MREDLLAKACNHKHVNCANSLSSLVQRALRIMWRGEIPQQTSEEVVDAVGKSKDRENGN